VFRLLQLVKKNQKNKIHAQNPDKAARIKQVSIWDQTSERL